MQLRSFQISNYRSVNLSGDVKTVKTTALVGRNESGKSNVLRALHSLNPADGVKPLSPIKDFPRHRRLQECIDTTPVLDTTWELSPAETTEVSVLWPRAAHAKQVVVRRDYKGTRTVELPEIPEQSFGPEIAYNVWTVIQPEAAAAVGAIAEGPQRTTAEAQLEKLTAAVVAKPPLLVDYSNALRTAINNFEAALAAGQSKLPEVRGQALKALNLQAAGPADDAAAMAKVSEWVLKKLPIFVYLDEYPQFDGHQDLTAYLTRKANGQRIKADFNFEKLCKVAGLDPQQLNDLLQRNDHETRAQLANRAGAVVTGELRRLWKDRALKVRFSPDAQHLDTLVAEQNDAYDVEVNLDERSRGLRWFFSFYLTFAADTKGGSAANAILLLDEPGLYLHATSQGDLLRYLRNDVTNQCIYSTHSPFMVPVEDLASIRTVQIDPEAGTTVSDTPTGDARTLFPLQAALGFDLAQSLFIGPRNLVVEGVTDYWYLGAIAEHLRGIGQASLPQDLVITPAGGAQKIGYMVALLSSQRLKVLVLLDRETQAERTAENLIKTKLIRDSSVLWVTDGFVGTEPTEADIEDLLDPAVYEQLVETTYARELAGSTPKLNYKIPRIVSRYEEAFAALGLEFHKTRPAREFLERMAMDPTAVLSGATQPRFQKLFAEISRRVERLMSQSAEPFR
jgi:energy-coupling factor transporter ATP-binding protein EcfA2